MTGLPQPPQPIVEMTGIVKSFFGVDVLHGVDFDVRPGEVHALVGENLSLIHISEPTRPY